MAQMFRKAILTTAAVAGFAGMSLVEEPLAQNQIVNSESASQDRKSEDNTDSMLAILGGMVAVGSLGAYLLTRKGKMFND